MNSVSRVSACPWQECALPATACDHECRRDAGGCVYVVVICCRTEKNAPACMLVQVGHVGRGALMHHRHRAIGATAVPLPIPCHLVSETCST